MQQQQTIKHVDTAAVGELFSLITSQIKQVDNKSSIVEKLKANLDQKNLTATQIKYLIKFLEKANEKDKSDQPYILQIINHLQKNLINQLEDNSKYADKPKSDLDKKEEIFLENIKGLIEQKFAGFTEINLEPEMISLAKDSIKSNIVEIRSLSDKTSSYKMLNYAVGFIVLEGIKKFDQNTKIHPNPYMSYFKLCRDVSDFTETNDPKLQLNVNSVFMASVRGVEDLYITGVQLTNMKTAQANTKM